MLSYNNSQAMTPLYDYYVETDLDSIDDQPVDYSKRYADQDSDEVCGTSRKKRHLSTPSASNFNPTKEPDDELKSYHIEGTPLIISSASSFCDLREVCSPDTDNQKQHFGKKPSSLPVCLIANESSNKVSTEVERKDKSESNEPEEKENINKGDHLSTENERFSKASSPIMFSRSSSICSLNSFEQHSIIDDRSSVSIFSTLPSGIISPSDIPDSPGEAMSPFIHKNKQQEFVFPPLSNEKSMEPLLADLKPINSNQQYNVFDDIPEDDVKVYNIEGSCTPMSSLSALSFQTNSNRVSVSLFQHKSPPSEQSPSIKITCSVSTAIVNKSEHILNETVCKESAQTQKNTLPVHVKDCSSETVLNLNGFSFQNLTSTGKGSAVNEYTACDSINFSNAASFIERQTKAMPFAPFNKKTDFSKDNSDDECRDFSKELSDEECKDLSDDESEALLEECIKNGMPGSVAPNQMDPEHTFKSTPDNQNPYLLEEEKSCSDIDDSEDESDILIKSCVQLGMPQKPICIQSQEQRLLNSQLPKCRSNEHLDTSSKTSSPDFPVIKPQGKPSETNNQTNNPQKGNSSTLHEDILDSDDEVLEECIKLGMSSNNIVMKDIDAGIKLPAMKNKSLEMHKVETRKSDDESDSDENDILVQQCIQLGMPRFGTKESVSKKSPKPVNYTAVNMKHLGYRDNCPDGMSDDEDDDDIVNECIKAGMPSAKSSPNCELKRPYTSSPKTSNLKSPSPRKLSAYEERAIYLKKYCYNNVMQNSGFLRDASVSPAETDDSPCVYRTEDTPILSPSASISDLSTLSFTEDKGCQESFLNNSRNSNCSSDSEDDELLLQCIRSGMPGVKRTVS